MSRSLVRLTLLLLAPVTSPAWTAQADPGPSLLDRRIAVAVGCMLQPADERPAGPQPESVDIVVTGGPWVVSGHLVTVDCRVSVNGPEVGPDDRTVYGVRGAGVAAGRTTAMLAPNDVVWLCTEVTTTPIAARTFLQPDDCDPVWRVGNLFATPPQVAVGTGG